MAQMIAEPASTDPVDSPPGTPFPRAWFDAATTLMLVLDHDGAVVDANASVLGYAGGDPVVGKPVWETELVARSPESAAALRDAVGRVALDRHPVSLDLHRRDAAGAVYTACFTIGSIGDAALMLAEGRDVTTERASAGRPPSSFGGESSDLPAALAGVRGALAMLEVGPSGHVSSHVRDSVLLARETADRLMRSVADLLDLERIRSGTVRISPIPTSGSDIASAAVDALVPLAAKQNVRLTTRDVRGGRALADRDRTAQALAILVSYAVCMAAHGGMIRVTVTRPSAERVRLSVDDPDAAIPAERRATLVTRIEQIGRGEPTVGAPQMPVTLAVLDRACDSDPDVGFGIAIARALVERQGGTIGASADAGDPAVCWVELVAAQDVTASMVLID